MGTRSKGGYKMPENCEFAFEIKNHPKPRPPMVLVLHYRIRWRKRRRGKRGKARKVQQ